MTGPRGVIAITASAAPPRGAEINPASGGLRKLRAHGCHWPLQDARPVAARSRRRVVQGAACAEARLGRAGRCADGFSARCFPLRWKKSSTQTLPARIQHGASEAQS